MLPSIVEGGATLRRLAFDPILIPLSASVAIGITFCVNLLAFVVFAAIQQIEPRIEWLLVIPLLAELYLFTIGLGLLLSALYVRFRDISQVWELAASLLFFACAIFYPVGILPDWAQKVAFLNPFVQVMQDIRHAMLGARAGRTTCRPSTVYAGAGGRLIPIAIVVLIFVAALADLPARGPLLRGEALSGSQRSRSPDVSKTFRIPHEQRTYLKEYFLHPFRARDLRAERGAPRT